MVHAQHANTHAEYKRSKYIKKKTENITLLDITIGKMMKDQKASSFHFHSCVAAESDGLTHWPKGLCSITFIAETEIEKTLDLDSHTRGVTHCCPQHMLSHASAL